MYEISEQQVERRDTIYPETLLITDSTETSEEDTLFNDAAMRQLEIMLNGDSTYYSPRQISCAVFYGQTKQGEDIKRYGINLPVISTAFGNAMTFSFSFEDNYSAGQQADKTGNGYFGNYVSYADYFGRIHWANFAFKDVPYIYSGVGNDTEGDYPSSMNDDIPFMLPQQPEKNITKNALITTADAPYLYRKNGEEIPAITYQVNLKTDSGYIIGSGFARNCPLVCGNLPVKNIDGQQRPSHEACKLYIFDKEIDKFTDHFENATNGQAITASLSGATDKKYIDFGILYAQTSGKSWAILTPPNIKKITVEDEDGNISTQQWQNGLAVIIAKNQTITSGEIIKLPRICIKKEIY